MPRTTAVELPGCPPLRALSFDILGLVKVTEARSKQGGVPKIVERWGDPDSSKAILAASIDDSISNPLLAVARKNGMIEGLSPINGDISFSISDSHSAVSPIDDQFAGLHLFRKNRSESAIRSSTLLTCMTKGKASLRKVEISENATVSCTTTAAWSVCGSGSICCCKVSGDESYSVFGGKGVELNMWDLEKSTKTWNARSPPKNSLGIFTPTWFTSVTFLNKDDHRKVVAGTSNHQVRLYDISAQRRPVMSVDFRETPIKAVAEDLDGYTIYFGTGSGDLASIDTRTGKLLGCFIGKCSGSIRSITRHPEHSVIASCGLDSYVRFWDTKSRRLLSAVFLKQHLTNVVFDTNFSDEEVTVKTTTEAEKEVVQTNEQQSEDEVVAIKKKRRKASKEKSNKPQSEDEVDDDEGVPIKTKRIKASKEKSSGTKKLKSKKKAKGTEAAVDDDTIYFQNE